MSLISRVETNNRRTRTDDPPSRDPLPCEFTPTRVARTNLLRNPFESNLFPNSFPREYLPRCSPTKTKILLQRLVTPEKFVYRNLRTNQPRKLRGRRDCRTFFLRLRFAIDFSPRREVSLFFEETLALRENRDPPSKSRHQKVELRAIEANRNHE